MKILYVTPRYYPHIGGVEYVVKSVAERLVKLGHEVYVITGEPNVNTCKEENINGVHIIRWPTWAPNEAYHVPKKAYKLKKILESLIKRSDIIHIHSVHAVLSYIAWGVLTKYKGRVKLVITPHYHGRGHTFIRDISWRFWRRCTMKMFKTADVIHVASVHEEFLIRKDYNVKSIVIEHGVDEDVLKYSWKPSDYILYAGRIERYKNIDRLARIVCILRDEYNYNLKLRIVGNGSYRNILRTRLDNMMLEYVIEDFKPRRTYLEILSQARLLGNLSMREAFSIVVNEANAMGVPTIIAKPWGINFAHRPRVLVIEVNEDDRHIAKKICEFLERAREEPKPRVCTWDLIVRKYLSKLY